MGDPAYAVPDQLGQYRILKHLATGGMAEVLLARDERSGRHVVLKRIRPDQSNDGRFVEMFLDEARIAAALKHPNIVEVFETGVEGSHSYFAMEYVHGEDLRRVLMHIHDRRDQLPIAILTGLIAGAAAGLHHAHAQLGPDHKPLGIVHRDVSPANILVGYDGVVKVTDFGIAKAALRTVETRSGTLKGKVSYMSPEQVTGKPVDRRSDVFALGIVLYELTTARRLFKGDNDWLTMTAIVQGPIPRPSTLRPELPRALEDIIMTALAGDPADRFQSADELGSALAMFTASLGMRMSASNIADYMKKMFGARPEPWLIEDDEVTATTTIDFDGSATGVVQVIDPSPKGWNRASPIAFAQAAAEGVPIAPLYNQTSTPLTGIPLAPEPVVVKPRSRRRILGIAGIAAVTAAAGMFVILRATSPDAPAAAAQTSRVVVDADKTPPPPPSPAPTLNSDPPPVVAEPAPAKIEAPVVAQPAPVAPPPPAIAPPKAPIKIAAKPAPPPKATPKPPPPPPKAVAKRPAKPKSGPGSNWDPDALFAPK